MVLPCGPNVILGSHLLYKFTFYCSYIWRCLSNYGFGWSSVGQAYIKIVFLSYHMLLAVVVVLLLISTFICFTIKFIQIILLELLEKVNYLKFAPFFVIKDLH